MKRLLAFLFVLSCAGVSLAQVPYQYPIMPSIHQAAGGGGAGTAALAATATFVAQATATTGTNPAISAASQTTGLVTLVGIAGGVATPVLPNKWGNFFVSNNYSSGAQNWPYFHTNSSDEAASTTVTGGAGPICSAAYSGVLAGVDVAVTEAHGVIAGGTTVTCPAITTAVNNSIVLCVCAMTGGSGTITWGSPSAGTVRSHIDYVSGTSRGCLIDDTGVKATAGAVASHTYTLSGANDWDCLRIALLGR